MRLQPVGRVIKGHPGLDQAPKQGREKNRVSVIEIKPEYLSALDGLGPGRWVWILLWFHRAERDRLQVHPRGDRSRPLVGVFAARSPHRPNPIGLDLGRIERISGRELLVSGLDAVSGTPVLDLKPYLPGLDQPDDSLEG